MNPWRKDLSIAISLDTVFNLHVQEAVKMYFLDYCSPGTLSSMTLLAGDFGEL